MPRNLVLCFDGTGGQPKASGNTNVVRLYTMLDLSDPSAQIAYYDPGVGTAAAPGAWGPFARRWTRLMGLAFGMGLRENLGEAYQWLSQHWEPGDRVYVFGFSRGAYTARALAGLRRACGLLRPGSENYVPYVVSAFSGRFDDMYEIGQMFGRPVDAKGHTTVPLQYLGVWDTVKAAGLFRGSLKWPHTHDLTHIAKIRHAVSLDERRHPFREYLITDPDADAREEVWFAGVHSDVGGTFADDQRLSTIALKWIVEEAVAQGLLVKPKAYAKECAVEPGFASATRHRNGPWWVLLGRRRRPVPTGARVHRSVQAVMAAQPGYDPLGGAAVTWADDGWASPPAPTAPDAAPAADTAGAPAPVSS